MTEKIIFPDGVGKNKVDFYGYTVYADGSVLNRHGTKLLRENKGHYYTFYVDKRPVMLSKRNLINQIFDKNIPADDIVYPYGKDKDEVMFYGYKICRDGRIYTHTGRLSRSDIIVIDTQNGKKNIKTVTVIYAVFSGQKPKKGFAVGYHDGNVKNRGFDNLFIKENKVIRGKRPLKLTKEDCNNIRIEYGDLCNKEKRRIEKNNHANYRNRPSLNYLATKYGVSRMTVLRVVNNDYHGL